MRGFGNVIYVQPKEIGNNTAARKKRKIYRVGK
jgi:hypothetical protein